MICVIPKHSDLSDEWWKFHRDVERGVDTDAAGRFRDEDESQGVRAAIDSCAGVLQIGDTTDLDSCSVHITY